MNFLKTVKIFFSLFFLIIFFLSASIFSTAKSQKIFAYYGGCNPPCDSCSTCQYYGSIGFTCVSSCMDGCAGGGTCSPVCGDGTCNGSETCGTCSGDCGACPSPTPSSTPPPPTSTPPPCNDSPGGNCYGNLGNCRIKACVNGACSSITAPPIGVGCPSANNICDQNTWDHCCLNAGACQINKSYTVALGIAPVNYTIAGIVFEDVSPNGKKDASETNYSGSFSVSVTDLSGLPVGILSNPTPAGNYLISGLGEGMYRIIFSETSGAYAFTYPPYNSLWGNSLIVTVGSNCVSGNASNISFTPEYGASCSSGSIINLNAGITNAASAVNWIQSTGSDIRWDSSSPSYSGVPPTGALVSLLGVGGTPGIIFTGTSSIFDNHIVSLRNWKVGGGSNPELFTTSHSLIPTAYDVLLETARGSGITPTPIDNISSSLTHGIYQTAGDLVVSSPVTFGPGNFIILVNGDLYVNAKITVPVGSTAIFSAKRNITVNRLIGESAFSTAPTIEGLYSADNDFVADGANSCPTIDNRLNVAGSVIANAGRVGGTFINNRTLCVGNSTNPSVSFIERPDFMLNYPSMVKQIPRSWQEVAP